ncbi:hypothetical protein HYH02_002054 [Chlamydomonas schloesseri]|uniref:VOC domain-containing protein n=1 Tax=Chlamydomonas schloesseri TaxID=2026947 RepID=A0A836BBT6_9CHLO|nr:hypothetical protein HYH02_002054 [Chlamydomonas schloesseri]|eukprot:KAG2453847.1 hypothetical protein HYH02_002054 [Chlamydomonas schloesseri]
MAQQELPRRRPLPLKALNHVSRCCRDVARSYAFYTDVLGFIPVKRPASFEFEGAWMFNYGIGLHLVKDDPVTRESKIEPKTCHISFQVSISLEEMEAHLKEWGLDYVKQVFIEDGVQVGQLFFHDPDNNMIAGLLNSFRMPLPAYATAHSVALLAHLPFIEVCNCHELPVVPLTEGILACANVAAINNAAAAVAAAAAMQPMAIPEEAINSLAAALAEVPGLMAAPPAAAAAAAAAAVAAATAQQQEAAEAEHTASNSGSGGVRCMATAALSASAESPDPAASPKMPITSSSCDAASAAVATAAAAAAAVAMPAPPPPHLGTPPLASHHLLADEAASTCSCSLDGCELLHDELALLHTSSCARADDDACSFVACGSSVAGGGGRRSHSFGSASMFSGFSGSCGAVPSLSQPQHMSSASSGLLLGVRDVVAAAAAVNATGGCGGGGSTSRSVCAPELDEWLSLLGTAASEPAPASAKGALGAPTSAFLASPPSGELAPPPGLSGLSCTELGAHPAAVCTERKYQAALGGEQAQAQQQQHTYAQYLRQRLAVAVTAAAAAAGAGAGGARGGGAADEVADPRRQKMREHAAMVSVIGAMGGQSAPAAVEPATLL